MNNRLYYADSYRTTMQAAVVAASDDGRRINLDQTVFYPTSGGQPHDLGTINNVQVLDVIDEGDGIIHVLAAPVLSKAVRGDISWPRRYDHMQQHTGQHLLSAVFHELFGFATLSFHMGEQSSTIELGTRVLTQHQAESVVLRANELARQNPAIVITFEDAGNALSLRKASARQGILRIVDIPGIDRSACGGTHVALLAEVLPVQIRDTEKVRGNARVSFVCGNRALTRSQTDFQILSRLAQRLAVQVDHLESHVTALQARSANGDKENRRLQTEAATRAGADLYLSTRVAEDGMRRVIMPVPVIDENARTQANEFATGSKAVLLMHGPDGVLLACSPDSGVNAGLVLKQILAKYGARGGGSPNLAQGSLPNASALKELTDALG